MQRQTGISAGLVGWASKEFQKLFGERTPACGCSSTDNECYHYVLPGVAEICYPPGGLTLQPFDYDAMGCLADLAHAQTSSCIDAEGSVCATPNTALGNVQKLWLDGLGQSADVGPLDGFATDKIKALFADIQSKGVITFNLNSAIFVQPLKDDDSGAIPYTQVAFRGTGANDC